MKAILVALAVFFCAALAHAGTGWLKTAEDIAKVLNTAVRSYEGGKGAQAVEEVADAYFGVFESEDANMEIAVRRYISQKKAVQLENGFNGLRKAMSKGAPTAEVRKMSAGLIEEVKGAAKELEAKGVKVDGGFSRE